jgi:DNA-binding beta-propeller fold protein YncE
MVCALALAAGGGVAQANIAYGETASLGGEGRGAGELRGPTGVAMEPSSGDLYIVDAKNLRVQKFGPSGEFILAFGKEVDETKLNEGKLAEADVCTAASHDLCKAGTSGAEAGQLGEETVFFGFIHVKGPTGIAVDPQTGDVYVADRSNRRVEKFSSEGAYLSQLSGSETPAGAFSEVASEGSGVGGVAVDPVPDTLHGGHDLYVVDAGNDVVDVFDAAGAYLRQLTGSSAGPFNGPAGVGFDAGGDAYVLDRGNRTVDKFTSGEGAGARLALGAELQEYGEAIAVDATGNVFVDEHAGGAAAHVAKFGPTGALLVGEFGEGSSAEGYDPSGVAVNASGKQAYLSGGYAAGGSLDKLWSFEEESGQPPVAGTGAASAITARGVTLTGLVKPEGFSTEYWFKYGLDETYSSGCGTEGCTTPRTSTASVSGEEAVQSSVGGLEPHATYHYRLVAKSLFGEVEGKDETLTTAGEQPVVERQAAGERRNEAQLGTEAYLEAQINPNGESTHYHFEYAVSPTLEGALSTPTPAESLEGYGGISVNEALTGLRPNTIYYYRVVAENGTGAAREVPIQSFRTRPPSPLASTEGASGITPTAADITGSVDPASEGPESEAKYFFEYSPSETPSEVSQCKAAPECVVSPSLRAGGAEGGESAVPENVELTELKPLTTYHYRIVAVNDEEAGFFGVTFDSSYGIDRTFTTLPRSPAVATDEPAAIGAETALLAGVVVPYPGAVASWHFEYGTTSAYGSITPAGETDSDTNQGVTASIAGLQPGTTYHYVLLATDAGGTTAGEEQTFTTRPALLGGAETLPAGFSLVGVPSSVPPALGFVSLSGLVPTPVPGKPKTLTPAKPKALTKAQKLASALKTCRKQPKRKRGVCEQHVRRKYGKARGQLKNAAKTINDHAGSWRTK